MTSKLKTGRMEEVWQRGQLVVAYLLAGYPDCNAFSGCGETGYVSWRGHYGLRRPILSTTDRSYDAHEKVDMSLQDNMEYRRHIRKRHALSGPGVRCGFGSACYKQLVSDGIADACTSGAESG